jgi:hypothetical protein
LTELEYLPLVFDSKLSYISPFFGLDFKADPYNKQTHRHMTHHIGTISLENHE